jgi:hypothetical protein
LPSWSKVANRAAILRSYSVLTLSVRAALC